MKADPGWACFGLMLISAAVLAADARDLIGLPLWASWALALLNLALLLVIAATRPRPTGTEGE